jgi:hypothetical protein
MLPIPPVGFFIWVIAIGIPPVRQLKCGPGSMSFDFIVLIACPVNTPHTNILHIQITVNLDIVLLVSTTFGVCSIPGIVIDGDTNPRVRLGAGSMTDGNADGAYLLWNFRVLRTTACFLDAVTFVLNVTGDITSVFVVSTDISSSARKLIYVAPPPTV